MRRSTRARPRYTEFLEASGLQVGKQIEPVVADRELARTLDVAQGAPLQHLRQIDYDTTGRPVMYSLEWHVPAVVELRVYRRGPGPVPGSPGSA